MKKIPLTKGKFALVDAADFDWLSRWKWHTLRGGRDGKGIYYAARRASPDSTGFQKLILMHHLLRPGNPQVDHRNLNGLDNRRRNLRVASQSQNNANRRKQKNCSSQYKGVTWHKRDCVWQAVIGLNGRIIYLGYFSTEAAAAHAYDKAARIHFKSFARLNFSSV